MKIGTYYRLPDGRKGLYVGRHCRGENFCCYVFTTTQESGDFEFYKTPRALEEYREPRTWEDEVLVYERPDGQTYTRLNSDKSILPTMHKLVGRAKVMVLEGEGL